MDFFLVSISLCWRSFIVIHHGALNIFIILLADQTPTPTRLIRNCEEVGLFDDLQHVNPFEETFRRAVESKDMSAHASQIICGDDTLHTPHVMPLFNISNSGKTDAMIISENSKETKRLSPNESCQNDKEKEDLAPYEEGIVKISVSKLTSPSDNNSPRAKCQSKQSSHHLKEGPKTPDRASVIFVPQMPPVVQPVSGVIYEISPQKCKPILPLPPQKAPQIIMLSNVQRCGKNIDNRSANTLKRIFPKSEQNSSSNNTRSIVKEKLKETLLKIRGNIDSTSGQSPIDVADGRSDSISYIVPTKQDITPQQPLQISRLNTHTVATTHKTKSASQVDKNFEKKRAAAAAKRYRVKFKNEHNNLKRKNMQLELENKRLQAELRALKTILLTHQDCSVSKAMRIGK